MTLGVADEVVFKWATATDGKLGQLVELALARGAETPQATLDRLQAELTAFRDELGKAKEAHLSWLERAACSSESCSVCMPFRLAHKIVETYLKPIPAPTPVVTP